MFIKQIKKKNKNSDKQYIYYRLVHTYKIGDKVRHQNILSLGGLETLPREKHKALADRIEEFITGNSSSLFDDNSIGDIDSLARPFADRIIKEKLFAPANNKARKISKEISNNYQEVDLGSIEQADSKEIGGEWLVKQAFDDLGIASILSSSGLTNPQINMAQLLLTGKLLHPSSELEMERWLKENSGARELYPVNQEDISRYRLYGAATAMYQNKDLIEKGLYNKLCNIFSSRSKIVIYDLTNMHFTGQMLGSGKAHFGRSKQKQTGSKLIGLALSIDSLGFVRYSKFYNGNISEPETFENMLDNVIDQLDTNGEKPIVVMDAGIATEDNLKIIREHNYDYVCVSRSVPKEYSKLTTKAESVTDNKGNKIELTKATVDSKEDNFLHIKSDQKFKKEESIDNKLSQRLETQLQEIKDKLPKKGTLKKTEKVHEKVGKIKAKLSKIGWLYDIKYTEDKEAGIVTDINWQRIKERERPKGEYFLRYTKQTVTESDIWDIYNMTRDVEAVFRCLKTDLRIRPIHHQKDKYIEPHIWLGIMAYQIVNYIRRGLKEKNIDYSWTTIVEKMRTMQTSIVSMNNKQNEKLYIKLCTRPTISQQEIFDGLKFKHRPFVRKTKVVPQL